MGDARRGPPPKPHAGKPGVCCWCGDPIPTGRRSWCSDECVRAYTSQRPAERRNAVHARDKGVCALCGRDCDTLAKRLKAIGRDFSAGGEAALRAYRLVRLLRKLGVDVLTAFHLWEADHVVPVCEGGSNDLSNLRTLCLCCHKRETRALAKRRAQRRRAQLMLLPEATNG